MAPGFTQPVAEMSNGRLFGGKALALCRADNLTAISEPIV
jgi:hypothetical protein